MRRSITAVSRSRKWEKKQHGPFLKQGRRDSGDALRTCFASWITQLAFSVCHANWPLARHEKLPGHVFVKRPQLTISKANGIQINYSLNFWSRPARGRPKNRWQLVRFHVFDRKQAAYLSHHPRASRVYTAKSFFHVFPRRFGMEKVEDVPFPRKHLVNVAGLAFHAGETNVQIMFTIFYIKPAQLARRSRNFHVCHCQADRAFLRLCNSMISSVSLTHFLKRKAQNERAKSSHWPNCRHLPSLAMFKRVQMVHLPIRMVQKHVSLLSKKQWMMGQVQQGMRFRCGKTPLNYTLASHGKPSVLRRPNVSMET